MALVRIPPFDLTSQLIADPPKESDGRLTIPNAPLLSPTQTEVDQFLAEELDTDLLNKLYPYLTFITTKSGTHIDPLDDHISKGREITVIENPALHLIWYYKTLYLKPIPHCLLNHNFWKEYLLRDGQEKEYKVETLSIACLAALGFLRSYAQLIRHESDFLLARDKHLIPNQISFLQFQLFINSFRTIPDEAVSRRYHYGQIRLSRLNWVVWLFPPHSWHYHRLDWQIGHYFTRWAPPLLFVWASTNLILSSMQVVHNSRGTNTWEAFNAASWIFAIIVLCFMAVTILLILVVVPIVYGKQLWFAMRTLMKEFWKIRDAEQVVAARKRNYVH